MSVSAYSVSLDLFHLSNVNRNWLQILWSALFYLFYSLHSCVQMHYFLLIYRFNCVCILYGLLKSCFLLLHI